MKYPHRIYHEQEKEVSKRIDAFYLLKQHSANNTSYQPLLPVA